MKALGVGALGTVIAQGVLGGITVLFFLPPLVSSAHAALGQTFFCIAVAIAFFTGRNWVACEPPQTEPDERHPTLLTLTFLSIFILYVQLFLGAMFRHHGMSWWPHVLDAPLVAIVLTWTAMRALTQYAKVQAIRRPAMLVIWLLIAQLCLGFLAFRDPRRVGSRCSSTGIADGVIDGRPCGGWGPVAGHYRHSVAASLALRSGGAKGKNRQTGRLCP